MDIGTEIAGKVVQLLVQVGPLYAILGAIVLGIALVLLARGVPAMAQAIAAWHERHRGEVPERTTDDAGDHLPGTGLPPMEVSAKEDGTMGEIPLKQGPPPDPTQP